MQDISAVEQSGTGSQVHFCVEGWKMGVVSEAQRIVGQVEGSTCASVWRESMGPKPGIHSQVQVSGDELVCLSVNVDRELWSGELFLELRQYRLKELLRQLLAPKPPLKDMIFWMGVCRTGGAVVDGMFFGDAEEALAGWVYGVWDVSDGMFCLEGRRQTRLWESGCCCQA